MKILILAAVLAICGGAFAGLPLASPYAYTRPLGLPVPGPILARPALAYGPAIAKVAPVEDYDPNPQYSYAYDIQDALTVKRPGLYYYTIFIPPSNSVKIVLKTAASYAKVSA